jgi:hypothetical protein
MKTIQGVSIWDNGKNLVASILDCYAINVQLGESATFYYTLYNMNYDGSRGIELRNGNLKMTGDDYTQWEVDSYAWDWVASQLNLTITGDYIPPVPPSTNPEDLETIS